MFFFVKPNGRDSNDGKSWSKAFKDVQTAIDTAAAVATSLKPMQVWIAGGTYYKADNTAFAIKNNVMIYGGFSGVEADIKERIHGHETILTVKRKDYNYVIDGTNLNADNILLDSLTITGAHLDGVRLNNSGVVNFKNCTITKNQCRGFNIDSSIPFLINCTISYNGMDGLIIKSRSIPTLINCTIVGNGNANDYGGVFIDGIAEAALYNCTIVNNRKYGIYPLYSSKTIKDCIIWGNSVGQIYDHPFEDINIHTTIVENCVIKNGYDNGVNIITEDPKLGKLSYNGGFVDTIPISKDSVAYAAGTTSNPLVTTDARGVPQTNPLTIGAYVPLN